jgi:dephospho-CoA kinase
MKTLYFIIGSSGSGKTTAVKNLQREGVIDAEFFYFDNVGVPSNEEMVAKFGSGEGWQKWGTSHWVKKAKGVLVGKVVVLDGQTRPSFIEEACKEEEIDDYKIILIDCSDEERRKRLTERGQPELAHADMMNWAKYLRNECTKRNCVVIDNTNFTQEQTRQALGVLIIDR